MGDLGMHACHVAFRAGWYPAKVRAILSNLVEQRPDGKGGMSPCETWDNATLFCETTNPSDGKSFPWTINLRWLSKHVPDTWQNVAHVSYVADYLAFRFCGRFVSDVPSASWTQLYSPEKRGWSQEILGLLDISPDTLPETKESGEVIGELLPEIAEQLGLAPSTKLVAEAFDQAAAAYGFGASADGRSVLSCGTAWVLYTVTGSPAFDKSESLSVCCHVNKEEWGMVLPFTGGSAYDWLHRTFGGRQSSEVSAAEAPVFIPHLYGGLSPDWQSQSKGSLLGLTMTHTWEDIRLALMRGLAFESRRNLEAAEMAGGRINLIRMVGGAGKSEIWSSNWNFDSGKLFEPASNDVELEERRYERYLKFYQALLPVYGAD